MSRRMGLVFTFSKPAPAPATAAPAPSPPPNKHNKSMPMKMNVLIKNNTRSMHSILHNTSSGCSSCGS